jgi:hypothetical protein
MRFWIREITGILLMLAGLYCFLLTISIITSNPSAFFSAIHTTVIGIFVFRGGIHLLKVAVAARIALATMQPKERRPAPPRQASRPAVLSEEW